MKHLSAQEFLTLKNDKTVVVDVRSPDEFAYGHLKGAINIPLDQLSHRLSELPTGNTLYMVCQSGNRSSQACQKLENLNLQNAISIQGGMNQLQKLGVPVERQSTVLPLNRQVQIGAGSLVVLGVALSQIVHEGFIFLSLGVGLGLTMAGITGFCGLAKVLETMPWNKKKAEA